MLLPFKGPQLSSRKSNREVEEYPSESSDLLKGASVAQRAGSSQGSRLDRQDRTHTQAPVQPTLDHPLQLSCLAL